MTLLRAGLIASLALAAVSASAEACSAAPQVSAPHGCCCPAPGHGECALSCTTDTQAPDEVSLQAPAPRTWPGVAVAEPASVAAPAVLRFARSKPLVDPPARRYLLTCTLRL